MFFSSRRHQFGKLCSYVWLSFLRVMFQIRTTILILRKHWRPIALVWGKDHWSFIYNEVLCMQHGLVDSQVAVSGANRSNYALKVAYFCHVFNCCVVNGERWSSVAFNVASFHPIYVDLKSICSCYWRKTFKFLLHMLLRLVLCRLHSPHLHGFR